MDRLLNVNRAMRDDDLPAFEERLRRAEKIDRDILERIGHERALWHGRERLGTHVRAGSWIDRAERGTLPVRIERPIE